MMNLRGSVDWTKIKAVAFDIDGTLYRQAPLRRNILCKLLWHAIRHPLDLYDIAILHEYRSVRARSANLCQRNLEEYVIKEVVRRLGVNENRCRSVVADWVFEKPLQYLKRCRYPKLLEFMQLLAAHGVKLGVFSDYPGKAKVQALGLPKMPCVSSTDPGVDAFKPQAAGLIELGKLLSTPISRLLYIGDRFDLDAKCAMSAGAQYLIRTEAPQKTFEFSQYNELIQDFLEVTSSR